MSLGKQVMRGSMAMLLISLVQRSLGLISTLVLARLLTPTDFGIVAIAFVVVHLSAVVCQTGARQYLIQVGEIDEETIDTAWTLDIAFRALAATLLVLALPATLWLWENSDATRAIAVLAPTLLLEALLNPRLHVDLRELRYDRLMRVDIGRKVVSFVVVLLAAWVLDSYWAIVIGSYASVLTGIVLSWTLIRRRPRLSVARIGTQWRFSKWILMRGYIGYLRAQIDVLMISRLFPVALVGQFSVAREIAVMPATNVIVPATQPLLSSFSRVREQRDVFARHMTIALLSISILIAPLCLFLLRHAGEFVQLALGDQWQAAGPLVQAMVPLLFGFALGGPINAMLIALGRVRALFFYDLLSLAIVVAALLACRQLELVPIVWVRSLIGAATAVLALSLIARHIGLGAAALLALLTVPLILALIASAATDAVLPARDSLGVIVNGVLFGGAYLVLVLLTSKTLKRSNDAWRWIHDHAAALASRARAGALYRRAT